MSELQEIVGEFSKSSWNELSKPAKDWINGEIDNEALKKVIMQIDSECGSCGCPMDPLYKRALELL